MTHWKASKEFFEKNGYWDGVTHPIAIARKYRRYLLETRLHQCVLCLTSTWMGQEVPLVVDHIDGSSENNSLDNLRLICGNCDMLLPTYKNKNRGNGRAYRRTRYREGKSF